MAEQRIPNPRVGSSNLSTPPATFKASAEMLGGLFYICCFCETMFGELGVPPQVSQLDRISGVPDPFTSATIKYLAEMVGL